MRFLHYPPTQNAARRQSKENVLLALYIVIFWVGSCFEAQYLTLRSVLFVSNLSGNSQLRQLGKLFKKFSKCMQLFSVLITLFQFYSIQLYSAERIFLRGLWLKTLESSWLLEISRRIFRALRFLFLQRWFGFLRLMRLFPLISYFLLPVVLEVQVWTWSSSALAVRTATRLGFQEAPPSFQEVPPNHFQPGPTAAVVFALVAKGQCLNSATIIGLRFYTPSDSSFKEAFLKSDLDSHGFWLFWEAGERWCDSSS